jgi:hypothetical protein
MLARTKLEGSGTLAAALNVTVIDGGPAPKRNASSMLRSAVLVPNVVPWIRRFRDLPWAASESKRVFPAGPRSTEWVPRPRAKLSYDASRVAAAVASAKVRPLDPEYPNNPTVRPVLLVTETAWKLNVTSWTMALVGKLARLKLTTDRCSKFGKAPAKSRMSRFVVEVGVSIMVKVPVPVGSVKFASRLPLMMIVPARPIVGTATARMATIRAIAEVFKAARARPRTLACEASRVVDSPSRWIQR